MNTRVVLKSPAIVLYALDYGESDRIITFYTREYGKLKGIAKGARRSKRRFSNALEAFSYSNIIFSKKGRGTLSLIEGCDVVNHHAHIREELQHTLIASYLIELIDKFTPEGKKNSELFQLLLNFLGLIDTGNSSEALVRFFEIRLLKLTGYEPVLDRCLGCGQLLLDNSAYYFMTHEGGIKCTICCRNNSGSLKVSLGTIKTLLLGKEADLEKIHRIIVSDQIEKESRHILVSFIYHLIGKEIKSLHVLNEIRKMEI